MNLALDKPLCFFDLETTGVNIVKDRIVEIGIVKLYPEGKRESKSWRVNPQVKIPSEASEVHGITDAMVEKSPIFKQIAPEVKNFLQNCDLAGFNSDRFDIPLLAEEFLRSEIEFDIGKFKTIDVQTIFHKMEKRTLEAAYKFYCNEDMKNAHSALSDAEATCDVLLAQLDFYKDLENTVKFLSEFSTHKKFVDLAGFIVRDKNNVPTFSFGKHKGKSVEEVLENEPGYFGLILNADFPLYTKKVLTSLKLRKMNNKK